MERHWQGLDFLRGLGIFMMLILHSAFYYFDGLWDIDLEKPPLIITLIGLLLMFAGLFGMISGTVHGISMYRLSTFRQWQPGAILRKKAVSAGFIMVVAWLYFVFTGPGLAVFAEQRMNNSILVEWIRAGKWAGFDLERALYIDSLVMISSNMLLVAFAWTLLLHLGRFRQSTLLGMGIVVMLISLVRIPLYSWYLSQVEQNRWLCVLAVFWLVNKNNPVLPFFAFGLIGSWIGYRLEAGQKRMPAVWLGLGFLLLGSVLYIFLPDTMLKRAIDLKWYSITLAQLGLFILLIIGSVRVFDGRHADPSSDPVNGSLPSEEVPVPDMNRHRLYRFFCRFSLAGLTAFFWESVVAAMVWRLLQAFWPKLRLGMGSSLLFGLLLAMLWGLFLSVWERYRYIGSLEYFYGLLVKRLGGASSKSEKLRGMP